MKPEKNSTIQNFILMEGTSKDLLFKKDIWEAQELGIKPDAAQSGYLLNFSKLNPEWLRIIVKQYVYYQAATKTYNTCRSCIGKLIYFGNFIMSYQRPLLPKDLNRSVILDYLTYLHQLPNLHETAKNLAMIHLRMFIETVAQEGWLPFPKERLIFNADIPKSAMPLPRFIPEFVMTQLQQHIPSLPEHFARLIFVLQETGRRIGEICTLPFDCLRQDNTGDYFLEVYERKTHKTYLIPITTECTDKIKEQQNYIRQSGKAYLGYLFVGKENSKAIHAKARHINRILNKLAGEKNIKDAQGVQWHFHSHQFRHTVGTRMINAGVSQPIVQRYLGHESPEMTNRYAHLHDQTLKEAFAKFQGNLINRHGKIIPDAKIRLDEEQWLKHNVMAQALPNGYCGLPVVQQRCPHANACLTCVHFRTNNTFLPQHEKQLEEIKHIITIAQKNGWQRQVETNQEVKISLEKIIDRLRGQSHESA
jgi:integrase/recombinase XerD